MVVVCKQSLIVNAWEPASGLCVVGYVVGWYVKYSAIGQRGVFFLFCFIFIFIFYFAIVLRNMYPDNIVEAGQLIILFF